MACAKAYIKSDPTLDTPAVVIEEFRKLVIPHIESLRRALPSPKEQYVRVAETMALEGYVSVLLEAQPEGWRINLALAVSQLMENSALDSLERKSERLTQAVGKSSLKLEEKEEVQKIIDDTKQAEIARQMSEETLSSAYGLLELGRQNTSVGPFLATRINKEGPDCDAAP